MIDHVSIAVDALARAGRFYDADMPAPGYPRVHGAEQTMGYDLRNSPNDGGHSYASVCAASVVADRRQRAFLAARRVTVDRFRPARLAAGGRDDGAPGPRFGYHPHRCAAFVADPDGNGIEAVCHRGGEG